jgi:hypothetical protein
MGSFLFVPAQEPIQNSSLLCFLFLQKDKCMGNGRDQRGASWATTVRNDNNSYGCWGLEGDSLGLGALWARDRNNQPFLGIGGQQDLGLDGLLNSQLRWFGGQQPQLLDRQRLLATTAGVESLAVSPRTGGQVHARTRMALFGQFLCLKTHRKRSSLVGDAHNFVCSCCSWCAWLSALALVTWLDPLSLGVKEQILIIFFVSSHKTTFFAQNATWCWAPNLLNRGRWWSWGLATSYMLVRWQIDWDVWIANKWVLENNFRKFDKVDTLSLLSLSNKM